MVLGGVIQRMTEAQRAEIRRVMLEHAKKLSRKDFIKKFTSDTFFLGKAADEKWWAGTAKIGTAEDAAGYYDSITELEKEPKDEAKDYVEDLNKLSKNNFIKKHDIFKHPNYRHKFSKNYFRQLAFEHLGGIKMEPINKKHAIESINQYNEDLSGELSVKGVVRIFNPFSGIGSKSASYGANNIDGPGVIHTGYDKPIELFPSVDFLGKIWEANKDKSKKFESLKKILKEGHININMFHERFYYNFITGSKENDKDIKIQSKKTLQLQGKNLSNELKELKKLYKEGTLSKDEFAKAKKKLLK